MRKWYPVILVVLTLLFSAVIYPRMPERVAMHFDLKGNPDNYGPRWEALCIMPAIMLVTWVVMRLAPRLDPRRENYERMQNAYVLTVNAVITILAVTHVSIVGFTLGWPITPQRIMPALIGGLFIVIGNVLPQARPNWFFGIRTPWTLTNDRVWERTHRVGGYLMFGAGVLSLIAALLPFTVALPVLLTSGVAAALGSVAYSYFAWKQEMSR